MAVLFWLGWGSLVLCWGGRESTVLEQEGSIVKSKYELGVEHFSTKRAIEEKVRGILNSGVVSDRDCVFLMDLFQNHDEWKDKVGVGVAEIRVGDAESVNPGGWGPSSCFWLVRVDGSRVQISYRHCLGNLGRRGWGNILSTYRTAARSAIDQQVKEFKRLLVWRRRCCGVPRHEAESGLERQ